MGRKWWKRVGRGKCGDNAWKRKQSGERGKGFEAEEKTEWKRDYESKRR